MFGDVLCFLKEVKMKLYSSKSDIWYYLVVYMEIMAVCLFGDILPSDGGVI